MPDVQPNVDRARIEEIQWEKLQRLLQEISASNRFYSDKLILAGVRTPASLEQFRNCTPFTFKEELAENQRQNLPFGTNLTYPLARYIRFHQTSGTAGQPIRWLDTAESWEAMERNWAEVYAAGGVRRGDRIFFAFSFGPFIGFWLAFEAAARLGALCLPGGGLSSLARLQGLMQNQATVLCCTPTYALHLAETARQESMELSETRVRLIMVAGEPGGSIPATRARLSDLWGGARVCDHHGMTETGPVSYECPVVPGRLHVIEESFIAEIIDPETEKPSAGRGELVLTTLDRPGSPVLRYRTRDVVNPLAFEGSTRCECGTRRLALEGGILGRTDDMIVVRGVNVFPAAIEEILRRFPAVIEYRVTVEQREEMTELRLDVELAEAAPEGSADAIAKALHSDAGLRIPVTLVRDLPRQEHKAKRWIQIAPGVGGP